MATPTTSACGEELRLAFRNFQVHLRSRSHTRYWGALPDRDCDACMARLMRIRAAQDALDSAGS